MKPTRSKSSVALSPLSCSRQSFTTWKSIDHISIARIIQLIVVLVSKPTLISPGIDFSMLRFMWSISSRLSSIFDSQNLVLASISAIR
jgi:hypothetical protein